MLFILILLLNINSVFSQVNIESLRNKFSKNKPAWGEIKGGLEAQRGNVKIASFDINVLLHYKKNKYHTFLQTKSSQGTQSDKKFKNNSFVHLRFTWMYHQFFGPEFFTQLQQDQFKNLKIRQLNGFGIRSELLKNKKTSISIGSGGMLDYESLSSNKESYLIRSTSYVSILKSFENKNAFLLTFYYQPLFNDVLDYRVNLESSLRTVLSTYLHLFLETSINFIYDTKPPVDINTNDLIIKSNVVYEW